MRQFIRFFSAALLLLCAVGTLPVYSQMGIDTNAIDYDIAREYELGGVEINGLTTLDERSLIARTGLNVGERISIPGDAVNNAIRNLWKLRLFSSIEIYIDRELGDVVFLRIETRELPRVSKFSLTGPTKGEMDDIRERIHLIRGTPYTAYIKSNVEEQIKDYYNEKGFLAASSEVFAKPDTVGSNNVIVNIVVHKGYKVKIDDINFIGNTSIADKKLRGSMKDTKEKFRFDLNRGSDSLGWYMLKPANVVESLSNLSSAKLNAFFSDKVRFNLFSSSKYKEDLFETDKQSVINYYNAKGFRDARIVRDSVYFIGDKLLQIDVIVDEGHPYYFRNITWRGNTKYATGKLDTLLGVKTGDLYNQERLETRLNFDASGNDIRSLYMDDGYLFFNITPVEVLVKDDSIDLEIRITEGPQAVIRNVIIKGNTRTNEHVIRRELRTLPGDKFSRSDIIRTQREIAGLGFFDPEQIGIVPIPNPQDGTVDIEYTVVERPSDQLELSAGWGGQGRGIVGSAGVSFNNFSLRNMFRKDEWTPLPQGDGQTLSFRINTNGQFYQAFNMSFTEPWFGGRKPNSLTFSAFRTLLSNGIKKNELGREAFATNGISLAYGLRLNWPDDFFSLLTSPQVQFYDLENWNRQNFFITNGKVNSFSLTETIARSSAGPNPMFPTSGSSIALSIQATPPYSLFSKKNYADLPSEEKFKWIEFHKWRFNSDWYTPLIGKFVLRANAKLGFVGYYNSDIGHSGFEQFQMGGDGISNFSIEGFDVISLRGYDPFRDDNGNQENAPIFNKFSLELRYPISMNPSSTVFVHAFAEGGNTYKSFDRYNPFELKRSAGLGIRAFLPMFGLLGLDYGIRFDNSSANTIAPNTNGVFDYIFQNGKFSLILGFEPE